MRLTALSFAIVGDFEDAVVVLAHAGAVLGPRRRAAWRPASCSPRGAGALGVQLGGPLRSRLAGDPLGRPELGLGEPPEPDVLPSAVGLVWRALVLWLLVILLVTLANYAPVI